MGQQCCFLESNTQVRESVLPVLIMEKTVHNTSIKLTCGNLIDENVDAVLAIADPQFNISSHLSRQILKLGGRQMHDDLLSSYRKKLSIDFGDVIYTHAEELDFDFVFFALLPSFYEIDSDTQLKRKMRSFQQSGDDSIESSIQEFSNLNEQKQYIQHSIKKTLMLCNDLGLSSISFPVIASESQINSKCYTALVMLLAIKQFIEEKHNQLKNLQLINITIGDKGYIKPFKHVLNRLTDGQQIFDYYETPQLAPQQEDYVTDSLENEIIQFGRMYKNRKEDRQHKQDSI